MSYTSLVETYLIDIDKRLQRIDQKLSTIWVFCKPEGATWDLYDKDLRIKSHIIQTASEDMILTIIGECIGESISIYRYRILQSWDIIKKGWIVRVVRKE